MMQVDNEAAIRAFKEKLGGKAGLYRFLTCDCK